MVLKSKGIVKTISINFTLRKEALTIQKISLVLINASHKIKNLWMTDVQEPNEYFILIKITKTNFESLSLNK
jgi:hypothetical protein